MGRNSGAQIYWTHVNLSGSEDYIWYCQQHAMYGRGNFGLESQLKNHIKDAHGCNEQ